MHDMESIKHKFINVVFVSLASLVLMIYGWYLGQLHQSGYDVAGIFLFITGVIGLLLALLIRFLTRKYSWHNAWFANLLIGAISCGIVFAIILLLARLHG